MVALSVACLHRNACKSPESLHMDEAICLHVLDKQKPMDLTCQYQIRKVNFVFIQFEPTGSGLY